MIFGLYYPTVNISNKLNNHVNIIAPTNAQHSPRSRYPLRFKFKERLIANTAQRNSNMRSRYHQTVVCGIDVYTNDTYFSEFSFHAGNKFASRKKRTFNRYSPPPTNLKIIHLLETPIYRPMGGDQGLVRCSIDVKGKCMIAEIL